ncbi:hypothetical protein EZV62_004455 [Acer yangbiense]|uniref:Cytochrome P450 n=1 Tax=Acer yangbiense TaxID=1000413 RepID=A0A5C7IJY4_9ROSI|nr:hypothetical protein EZV62_004455 [Acer yangbiense]
MDLDLYQYLFYLIILYVSVGIIYLFHFYKSSKTINLPPGNKGYPLIGETFDYVMNAKRGNPEKFVNDRTAKYSPDVFRTSLLGQDMAVFCGASAHKCLFSGTNKYIQAWWPPSMKKIMMHDSKNHSSVEESAKIRVILPRFLKIEALQPYIPVIDAMAKKHLETEWSPYKEVKVFPLVKKFTFGLACRLLASIEDPKDVAEITAPFDRVIAGLISVPINVPGTTYYRAVQAGKVVREIVMGLITKRKKELEMNINPDQMDVMTSMLHDDLDAVDICNKLGAFFVASFDTTSSAITFIIKSLAEYPHVYQRVYEEQMEILKAKKEGEPLNWEDVKKMKYTWCTASEVLRLYPPSIGAFREAKTDFSYGGYTIPKGWKIFWNAHTTHKNPKYFPDPEKFDPSRFEGSGPPPYTFVPFGGGPYMCPGKEYARLQILVFMHNIVTKFKWEKLIPNEKYEYIAAPFPVHDLPVSLEPIQT